MHTINTFELTYDAAKSARNVVQRGLSFELARTFDFQAALFTVDERKDYGEVRHRGLGWVGNRLHVLVFTETLHGIRVISFRKANEREARQYEKADGCRGP